MSAEVVRNSRDGEAPPDPPRTADGGLYPYGMFYSGMKYIAYADSPEDLLDVLIPGYLGQEETERLKSRIMLAADMQTALQAQINAAASTEDMAALSETERAMLAGPRFNQPDVDVWSSPIPLVLVDSGYAPYTALNRPISALGDVAAPENMVWLRPLEEWEFLTSLSEAGVVRLVESIDF